MEPDFNVENAAADIASDLGFGSDDSVQDEVQEEHVATEATNATEVVEQADPYVEPPKSWKKEYHEIWKQVPASAREIYYNREKQMLDGLEQYKSGHEFGNRLKPVYEPYREFLQQQGLDEVKATQYLLAAQHRLHTGTPEQRREMISNLAREYGVTFGEAQQAVQAQENQLPPEVTEIKKQVDAIQSFVRQQAAAQTEQVRAKVSSEVESFAKDHEFFDDVADEIAKFVGLGYDLPKAYEMATWANPVVRQKQIEKETTSRLEAAKAKSKEEAEAARKATSSNVRTRASNKAPTEPLGSWDDTMKETLAKVKAGAL